MYIPLHGRSTYSFLESIGSPKSIIKRAKELNYPSIAITDIDGMAGSIQFYQVAKAKHINPIIGVEVGFVLDVANAVTSNSIGGICLIATNDEGYLNLMNLVSFAGKEGIAHRPKIDIATLEKYKAGILCFSGGPNSRIAKMLNNSQSLSQVGEILTMLKGILGKENCYLEIIAQNEKQEEEIAKINKSVLELAQTTNIDCLVDNIYMYPKPEDKRTQELAMAIKDNLKLYDPEHRAPTTQNHIMTEEEIKQICLQNNYPEEQINARMKTNEQIANRCKIEIQMGQMLFPNYEVAPEHVKLYNEHQEEMIEIQSE